MMLLIRIVICISSPTKILLIDVGTMKAVFQVSICGIWMMVLRELYCSRRVTFPFEDADDSNVWSGMGQCPCV
jgi:hypothetical protein